MTSPGSASTYVLKPSRQSKIWVKWDNRLVARAVTEGYFSGDFDAVVSSPTSFRQVNFAFCILEYFWASHILEWDALNYSEMFEVKTSSPPRLLWLGSSTSDGVPWRGPTSIGAGARVTSLLRAFSTSQPWRRVAPEPRWIIGSNGYLTKNSVSSNYSDVFYRF